jgi:hypothetical protein
LFDLFSFCFRLGECYWKRGGEFKTHKQFAQTQFLMAAKLNPNESINFTYLGHFYRTVENDSERAEKCYKKALTLSKLFIICSFMFVCLFVVCSITKFRFVHINI